LEREKENDETYKNPVRGELIELERIATMFHSWTRYTSKTIRGDLHTAMTTATTTIEFSPFSLSRFVVNENWFFRPAPHPNYHPIATV
jgi:hypothetical protein